MKKWYVITGILALLLFVSPAACSSNELEAELVSAKAELANAEAESAYAKAQLASAQTELADVKVASTEAELAHVKTQLASIETELASAEATNKGLEDELTQLKSASFGKGLGVFEVSQVKSEATSTVSGKVQNTSNLLMKRVYVIVVTYEKDGSLRVISTTNMHDLYPTEVREWMAYSTGFFADDSYAVYAFGNK